MIIKEATQIGNPIIRKVSKPVKNVKSVETKKLVKDLTDSMRYHGLVGMAAPQIGKNLRIFVSEIKNTKYRKPLESEGLRVFINPKIISRSKKIVADYEGCGSVAYAELFGAVPRPAEVTVEAYDLSGTKFKLKTTGLLARVIQHEQDHLDGKVFLDRMKDMASLKSRGEIKK